MYSVLNGSTNTSRDIQNVIDRHYVYFCDQKTFILAIRNAVLLRYGSCEVLVQDCYLLSVF